MSKRPGLIRRLEAAILLPLAALLRRCSPKTRVRVGHAMGSLAHLMDAKHRRLARANITASFGVSEEEAAGIARSAFRHFGRLVTEVLASKSYGKESAGRLFDVEGFEHFEQAHKRGKGVILFSAHIGNWELIPIRLGLAGFPVDLIARPLDNPWLEQAFRRWRESTGNTVLSKRGALRQAVRSLRQGRVLAILIDQNVIAKPRVFVPFFGRLAATTPTLGTLAIRMEAPIIPVVSIPQPDGSYRVIFGPEIERPTEGDMEERVRELTCRATRVIEGWIRAEPGTWLWLHNRWKSRPEPGEET